MEHKYAVKRQGRNFGVYRNGKLIEGGFFSKIEADKLAWELGEADRAERSKIGKQEYDFQN